MSLYLKRSPGLFNKTAPGHKAKSTEKWLSENVPDCIKAEYWPSSSSYLNPFDYELSSLLESTACSRQHTNIE